MFYSYVLITVCTYVDIIYHMYINYMYVRVLLLLLEQCGSSVTISRIVWPVKEKDQLFPHFWSEQQTCCVKCSFFSRPSMGE